MRLLILLTALLITANFGFCQSQADMNIAASKDYKKSDKELNSVYQKILQQYASDTVFIKNFKKAQKIWIQYRDAEMQAKYPHPNEYGSVFPMCYSMELQALTVERTKKLKIWLVGIEEGEVCAGSVKIKNQ